MSAKAVAYQPASNPATRNNEASFCWAGTLHYIREFIKDGCSSTLSDSC
jgi:hypothetical protein